MSEEILLNCKTCYVNSDGGDCSNINGTVQHNNGGRNE